MIITVGVAFNQVNMVAIYFLCCIGLNNPVCIVQGLSVEKRVILEILIQCVYYCMQGYISCTALL